jgi:hypothetical protein
MEPSRQSRLPRSCSYATVQKRRGGLIALDVAAGSGWRILISLATISLGPVAGRKVW